MRSRRPPSRPTVAAAVAAALAVVTLAGCGSSSSSSSSTTASTVTSTTTGASTTAVTVLSNHCRSENLTASLGPADSGAGQRYNALVLTNTGSSSCELRGFPGVSLLDASGAQIGNPATREGAEGATVTLPPGGTASAALHTSAAGMGATCTPTANRIRVFPPDNTVAIVASASYTACGTFSVSTLVSGNSGH